MILGVPLVLGAIYLVWGAAVLSGAVLEFVALVQAIGWWASGARWPAFMLFAVAMGWGDTL